MANVSVGERVARVWGGLSNRGVNPLGGSKNRPIVSANQFSILAALFSVPYLVLFLIFEAPLLWGPALGQALLIGSWALVLFLNSRGLNLVASMLSLVAPVAQFTYLSYFFTSDAGFHLYLLGGGALAFAVLRTGERIVRTSVIAMSAGGVLVASALWADGGAHVDLPDFFVPSAFALNAVLVIVLFYVIARFNHRYYVRERGRNEVLLESAQLAAQTDALTEVYNRRGVAPILSSVARRGDYSLALVDLDRFKLINDRLGHGAGDVVLANAARTLVRSVGDDGTVARWGGEEFLVVLAGLSLADAHKIMERARVDMEAEYGAPESLARVTISIGLAHAPRYAGKEEVLRLADANLYEAKSSGRNVVISAQLASGGHE